MPANQGFRNESLFSYRENFEIHKKHFAPSSSITKPPRKGVQFSLVPVTADARNVVLENKSMASNIVTAEGDAIIGLDITVPDRLKTRELATVGRNRKSTIQIESNNVSGLHCTFEINPETRIALVKDLSTRSRTSVFKEAPPTKRGTESWDGWDALGEHRRQVALLPGLRQAIFLGDIGRYYCGFKLYWHNKQSLFNTTDNRRRKESMADQLGMSMTANTAEHPDILVGNARVRLRHPPLLSQSYLAVQALGQGGYGQVSKGINMGNGSLVAIKTQMRPQSISTQIQSRQPFGNTDDDNEMWYGPVENEIHALVRNKNDNIVTFVGYGSFDDRVEIYLELAKGSIDSLIQDTNPRGSRLSSIIFNVRDDMLKALSCLADHYFIHGDVKPGNILFQPSSKTASGYQYKLSDFGLSTTERRSVPIGFQFNIAPEFWHGSRLIRTSKADIWSLYITLGWLWNQDIFGKYDRMTTEDIMNARTALRQCPDLTGLHSMAQWEPNERPSAVELMKSIAAGLKEPNISTRTPIAQRAHKPANLQLPGSNAAVPRPLLSPGRVKKPSRNASPERPRPVMSDKKTTTGITQSKERKSASTERRSHHSRPLKAVY